MTIDVWAVLIVMVLFMAMQLYLVMTGKMTKQQLGDLLETLIELDLWHVILPKSANMIEGNVLESTNIEKELEARFKVADETHPTKRAAIHAKRREIEAIRKEITPEHGKRGERIKQFLSQKEDELRQELKDE